MRVGLVFLGFQKQECSKVFLRISITNVYLGWCPAVTGFQECPMTKVSSQIGDDKEIRMTVGAGRAQWCENLFPKERAKKVQGW